MCDISGVGVVVWLPTASRVNRRTCCRPRHTAKTCEGVVLGTRRYDIIIIIIMFIIIIIIIIMFIIITTYHHHHHQHRQHERTSTSTPLVRTYGGDWPFWEVAVMFGEHAPTGTDRTNGTAMTFVTHG